MDSPRTTVLLLHAYKNECGFPSQSLQRFKSKALRIRMSHHQQQSRWKRFVAIVNSGIVVQPPSNITGEETWMAIKTLTHRCIRLVYGVLQWYYYHYCQFELFTCPSAINLSIHPSTIIQHSIWDPLFVQQPLYICIFCTLPPVLYQMLICIPIAAVLLLLLLLLLMA